MFQPVTFARRTSRRRPSDPSLWGMTYAPALLVPACLAVLAYTVNLTQTLGAHPWWAAQVIWIGLFAGLVLGALAARLPGGRSLKTIGAAGLTAFAFGAAHLGKIRFAASYAEDQIAGQMWYFGWIAACALAAVTLLLALWPRPERH